MNRQRLEDMLVAHEGLRLKPYLDTVGKLTIGVGRNLTDVGITKTEALLMLDTDIDQALHDLDVALPWWKTQPEDIQLVLADMCFNLGIAGLVQFKDTLHALESGRYEDARHGMLASKWATQVGNRAIELANMVYKLA